MSDNVSEWMPPPADRMLAGQPYWHVGQVQHVNRQGIPVMLDVWVTCCAECGAPFRLHTPPGADWLTRRCKSHRRPGVTITAPSFTAEEISEIAAAVD